VNCIDVQLHIAVLLIFMVKYSGKHHGVGVGNHEDCNMTHFVFKKRNTNNCVLDVILHNTSFS